MSTASLGSLPPGGAPPPPLIFTPPRVRESCKWKQKKTSTFLEPCTPKHHSFGSMLWLLNRDLERVSENARCLENAWRLIAGVSSVDKASGDVNFANWDLPKPATKPFNTEVLTPRSDASRSNSINIQTMLDSIDEVTTTPRSYEETVIRAITKTSMQRKGQTISQIFNLRPEWCNFGDEILSDYKQKYGHLSHSIIDQESIQAGRDSAQVNEWMQSDVKDKFQDVDRCVLHPTGTQRIVWNFICLLCIMYDIITIPLLAFEMQELVLLSVLDWLCAICWTLDIAVAFRTGYFSGSNVEMRIRQIALHYAKTWLVLDLFIVGFDWFSSFSDEIPTGGSVLRTTRISRILRCCRLLRLGKLQGLWGTLENQVQSSMLHLCLGVLKLTAVLLVAVHIITCAWYAIGDATDGWTTYFKPHISEQKKDVFFWYFASCRWTLAQINGRTDMDERRNIAELVYTCLVAVVFAIVFMAVFISSITAVMMDLSSLTQSRTSLQRMVRHYLASRPVSSRLVGNLKNHMGKEAGESDHQGEEEAKVLACLPQDLAQDLIYEVRVSVFTKCSLFAKMNPRFPRAVRHLCHSASSLLCPRRSEIIFERGDACKRTLFVDNCTVLYAMGSEEDVADEHAPQSGEHVLQRTYTNFDDMEEMAGSVLRRGDWISEAALWIEWINRGRLIAGINACLIALSASEFAATVVEYRGAYAMSVLYAQQFVEKLKKVQDISDLPVTDTWYKAVVIKRESRS